MANLLYRIFFYIMRLGLHIWFRSMAASGTGNIPKTGPVIFAANHPNMVLDPVLVAVLVGVSGRMDGHFWAKAPLFKGFFGWLLTQIGGVPVYRRQDVEASNMSQEERMAAIEKMFAASMATLEKGECLFVFPEGTSTTSPHIGEIKPGTAKLALSLLQQKGLRCPIVPVGLNYIAKDSLGSQVLVQFGEPLFATLESGEDAEEAVQRVTAQIERGIKAVTINATSWQDLMLLDLARQIYTSDYSLGLAENVALAQRFSQAYYQVEQEPRAVALKKLLQEYHNELRVLGLRDRFFNKAYQRRAIVASLAKHLFHAFMSLVLALPGYLLHLPLHYLGLKANKQKHVETISQTKFALLIGLVPLVYMLVWLLVYLTAGFNWLIVAVLALPLFGYLHVVEMIEGEDHARSFVALGRLLLMLLTNKQQITKLRQMRESLSNGITELAKEIYGDDRVLLRARKAEHELDENEGVSIKTFENAVESAL